MTRPTRKDKRIDLLDVYRGFAVMGIFVVNIGIMNSTFVGQEEFSRQWTSPIDQLTERFLQLFFYTKFFPIFSLLFGLGLSMQVLKLRERKELSFRFFARRMFILFVIGLCHIVFLWSGDVLNLYALLGLLVVPLVGWSNKSLLLLSAFFLLFPFYNQVFSYLFEALKFEPGSYLSAYNGTAVHRVISQGSYLEGVELRLREYMANIPLLFGYLAPTALAMFLLGVYLGKNRIQHSLAGFIAKIKVPELLLALITNSYRILFLFVLPETEIYSDAAFRPYLMKAMVVSDVAMGIFYLWVIGWLWHQAQAKKLLSPLKYVGRMALTNYIMQSIIGLFLFSSLGFSMYESLSPLQALLTAFAVFGFQLIFSRAWLSYFRFGPLEWLWRCFTYKKLLPITKPEPRQMTAAAYRK